jgi:hypothetical protein
VDLCVDDTGDLNGPEAFWNFNTANAAAVQFDPARPATGCTGYANPFGVSGSGIAFASQIRSHDMLRFAIVSYRPSLLLVAANAKLFAFRMTIDASTSIEAGGSQPGCTSMVAMTLEQLTPETQSGSPTTILTTGSQMLNYISVNGAPFVVATQRHSWGALKAMYR